MKKYLRWLVFYNIGRTWDGKNKETLKSHDINIVLFNHLRINPRWRRYNNEKCVCLFICWIKGSMGEHLQFFYISAPPFKLNFGELGIKVKIICKSIWNWRKVRCLKKDLKYHNKMVNNFYDDPYVTSGYVCCTDDFQEDFNRQERAIRSRLVKETGDYGWAYDY